MPKDARDRREPAAAHLLGTTRTQILSELCGRGLTATELAERFSVSSNAIRTHLGALRSASLVRYRRETRGVGKPTHVYELTPEGEFLLSRAYAPALRYVLGAMREAAGDHLAEIVRAAGRRLARESDPHRAKDSSIRRRSETCAALLRSLGGSARVELDGGRLLIRSECCPLSAVVSERPVACKLFEGMARELTGRDVEEHCDRTQQPHCLFVVPRARAL